MRRFLAPALPERGGLVVLSDGTSHHLLRVARIARGESVLLFDGRGREAEAVLTEVAAGAAVLEIREDPRRSLPEHPLHLLLALLKGPSMDEAVRMATEAGATSIRPFAARRSVARGDRESRWLRIATSAAQQCGRGDVPTIAPVGGFGDAMRSVAAVPDRRIALPGSPTRPRPAGEVAALVGPEGGFTDEEVAEALDTGFAPMGLGPWTLRAETAAVVAVALCT